MYVIPEQLTATNKAGIELQIGLANAQFAAFERLSALNFNAANSAYDGFARVSKQATDMAESNFAAATSAVKEAKAA